MFVECHFDSPLREDKLRGHNGDLSTAPAAPLEMTLPEIVYLIKVFAYVMQASAWS